ncbi:hypothetical protein FACS189446_0640 [Bacteroidia bacterium]|nr:hypothetical protein FACS189446_0640 [Bacteroidia bacterium]
MKKFCLLIILALSYFPAKAGSLVTGYVFEDLNGNGKRNKSEKGIADVAVSNGSDVVLTDATGKYLLPVDGDNIIFVIKPAGYKMSVDTFNLPRFFYIYKPEGSPELRYKGVQPTGPLPASVDFPLQKYNEPETFTAMIFGDTQPYTDTEIGFLRDGVVAEAKQATGGAIFGITLGDLVGDSLDLHKPYKEVIKQMGLPWYHVMGNHDMNYDVKEDKFSDERFEADFGPNTYSFNYGKAHFIILDDILYPNPVTGKGYLGGFREDQMKFIENDLKYVPENQLVVISLHIPVVDVEESGAFRNSDRRKLYTMLEKYPKVLILSAHTHFQCQAFSGNNIHEYNVGTVCGDWFSGVLENGLPVTTMRDGTPPGYAFLKIAGNQYTLDYKVWKKPASYQISVYNPKVVRAKRSTSASIYANFFMGSSRDTVEYRVDNGQWRLMQRSEEFDPAYYRYVQDWDYLTHLVSVRRPSNPDICQHLWKGRVVTDLPVGEHRIEVRAKDRFGQVFTQESSYRIEE